MTSQKPRVLLLVTEDWYFCSHRLPVARALKAAGFDVAVACRVTAHGAAIESEGLHLYPLAISRRSLNPFHLIASLMRIVRTYRAFRPDIVHHVALKPALIGSLAARIARIPMRVNALAGLGYIFTSRRRTARLLKPLVRQAMRLLLDGPGTRVIVQNADDGRTLTEAGIVASGRLALIAGSGVDLDRFQPAPEPPSPVRVTMVARMIREKGVEDLVAAARILAGRGTDVKVTLAGLPDPENHSSIPEAELKLWASEGPIEWLGHVEDIADLWAQSHIACLPSYYGEGVPLSLIEAAACGRPMIAADGPGLRDIVVSGKTGILVPARDAVSLADAIIRLANDAELRRDMGAAARTLAASEFGAARVTERTLALYRDLMGPLYPG
jgi:glycosyltransferase involved in cell wall biosynthesis